MAQIWLYVAPKLLYYVPHSSNMGGIQPYGGRTSVRSPTSWCIREVSFVSETLTPTLESFLCGRPGRLELILGDWWIAEWV